LTRCLQGYISTKIGIDEFGEYLSLLSAQITKGFVSVRLAAVPNKLFRVILIVDGKLITTGVSGQQLLSKQEVQKFSR
jgi:hypothetical protein